MPRKTVASWRCSRACGAKLKTDALLPPASAKLTMRFYFASSLAVCLTACSATEAPPIEQLEIWAPGLEVAIDGQGNGRFKQYSKGTEGRFTLSAAQFAELRKRTEPFRLSRDAISSERISAFIAAGQRCDGDYVTDNGGISFHWSGRSMNQFYAVDYGCERVRYATRNGELRAILASLPVPKSDALP